MSATLYTLHCRKGETKVQHYSFKVSSGSFKFCISRIRFVPYHTIKVLKVLPVLGLFWLYTNLRIFIGATPSQVLVLGLNRSTEFRQLVPSFPPATYSIPSNTATPALLRRLSMLAMAVHVLLCSFNHNAEQWTHLASPKMFSPTFS